MNFLLFLSLTGYIRSKYSSGVTYLDLCYPIETLLMYRMLTFWKRNLDDLPMPENYHDGAASTPLSNSQWMLEGLLNFHGSLALGFTCSELEDVSFRWPKTRASATFDCPIRSNLGAIARDRINR